MNYDNLNTLFKRLHIQGHQQNGVPIAGRTCLALNCGQLWRTLLRSPEYQKGLQS